MGFLALYRYYRYYRFIGKPMLQAARPARTHRMPRR